MKFKKLENRIKQYRTLNILKEQNIIVVQKIKGIKLNLFSLDITLWAQLFYLKFVEPWVKNRILLKQSLMEDRRLENWEWNHFEVNSMKVKLLKLNLVVSAG